MNSNENYLTEFVYDTKLKDLGIFSKQYFNSVLYSMYREIPEDKLLCFTFGDFNKLNQLNKTYSYETGDIALKNSLKLIKENLPEDTIIARIAGDEFAFLTPNAHKKDMDLAFQNISNVLESNGESVYGLTITTSSMDSSVFSNFDELYAHTELDVNRKKKINVRNQFKNAEDFLSDSVYKGLSNYFSYYRIEANALPKEYYTILRNSIIDVVIHHLEKPNNNMLSYIERLKSMLPQTDFENKHLDIQPDLATKIHDYVTKTSNPTITKSDEFNKLFQFLITDPLTGEVSKKFFDEHVLSLFAENKSKPISVRLFDLAHLKLSNDVIGHNQTDEKINELYMKLVSQITNANSHSKYLASAGNCGLLLIENADSAIPEEKIDSFINTSLSNEGILSLTTASRVCNPSEISETINLLNEDCKQKKEKQKLIKINRRETIIPLNLALGDSIHFYKQNINNPYSIQSKQLLVNILFKNLNRVIAEQFPNQTLNIFANENPKESPDSNGGR